MCLWGENVAWAGPRGGTPLFSIATSTTMPSSLVLCNSPHAWRPGRGGRPVYLPSGALGAATQGGDRTLPRVHLLPSPTCLRTVVRWEQASCRLVLSVCPNAVSPPTREGPVGPGVSVGGAPGGPVQHPPPQKGACVHKGSRCHVLCRWEYTCKIWGQGGGEKLPEPSGVRVAQVVWKDRQNSHLKGGFRNFTSGFPGRAAGMFLRETQTFSGLRICWAPRVLESTPAPAGGRRDNCPVANPRAAQAGSELCRLGERSLLTPLCLHKALRPDVLAHRCAGDTRGACAQPQSPQQGWESVATRTFSPS